MIQILRMFSFSTLLGMSVFTHLQAKEAEEKTIESKSEDSKIPTGTFEIDKNLSELTLRMSHSVMGRFESVGKASMSGKLDILADGTVRAAKIEFNPSTFDSLISLRDAHIKKDYLEIEKYPVITLEKLSTRYKNGQEELLPFSGTLVVKGKRVPVNGIAKIVWTDDELLRVTGSFPAKVSDFPVKKPRYMGIGVLDDFEILVDFYAKAEILDEDLPSDL